MPRRAVVTMLAAVAAVLAFVVGCAPSETVKRLTEDELKARRDSAQASYSIASGYFAQNNLQSALENFEQALGYDSTYYEAYVAIGAVYRKMQDPVQAEDYFRKAMRIEPRKAKAYEGLGDLFLAMSKLDDALAVYQQGLGQDSSLSDLYNGVAEVYVRKGEMPRADSVYQVALRRFPDDLAVQRLWADFLYKQKRFQEAANALLPLVKRFPTVGPLREKLAGAYTELKQYPQALAQLDTLLVNDPGNQQAVLTQGVILTSQGKSKQAIEKFDRLIAQDSTKPVPVVYKAEALMQQGNYSAAETQLRRALQLDAGMAQALVDLGDIRQKQADQNRGTDLAATPTAKLRTAKSLYEEAKSYYQRGAQDAGYGSYARIKTEYVTSQVSAIDKELFVREQARHAEPAGSASQPELRTAVRVSCPSCAGPGHGRQGRVD